MARIVVLAADRNVSLSRPWRLALMLGAYVGWGALRAWAGGGPCGYLVVYDPTDTNSVAVANYYQQVRHIPEANMVPYVFSPYYAPLGSLGRGMGLANTYRFITNLQNIVTSRGMTGHFNGIAMAGISPVDGSGITNSGVVSGYDNSMLTALYQSPNYSNSAYINCGGLGNGAFREPPVQQTTEMRSDITFTNNSYSDTSLGGRIYTGRYWCVSYVGFTGAGANAPQDVFDYLQRSKAADGNGQGGVIYCPFGGDTTRYGIRGGTYANGGASAGRPIATAVAAWKAMGIAYAQTDVSATYRGSMTQAGDIGGETVGSVSIAETAPNGNTYLPGAWADHATSNSGNIDYFYNGQSTCALWLHAGAYGTFGCMSEPYALAYKFPHPHIHTHFRNGASLAEAFWQSMIWSMEGVVLGDPLLQPYASFPVVTISTPAADGATVSGSSVAIAASAGAGAVNSNCTMAVPGLETNLDLAVDGHVVNIGVGGESISVTRNSGTSFTLDTTTLSDGYHELRVIAYNNNSVRTQGETTRTIFVNNQGQSVAISGATTVDYAGGSAALTVTPSGISNATNLTIQANGRTLASLPVGGGTTNLPGSIFAYQGTTTVYAVAWLSNSQQVWSAPQNIAVTWTPLAPQPVVLTTNQTAIVKYYASTTNSGFNWNTTTPTAIIGYTNILAFNTNTLSAVLPPSYATAPGYEVDSLASHRLPHGQVEKR